MVNRSREREAEEERERERDGEGGEEKAKTARIHLFPALFASHSATEGSKDTTGNSIRALPIATTPWSISSLFILPPIYIALPAEPRFVTAH